MAGREAQARTCYEALHVTPTAPLELITAAYWRLAGQAQERRASDQTAETELHQLTLAYLVLNKFRSEYDESLGFVHQKPAAPETPVKQAWFARPKQKVLGRSRFDYYEMLRVTPFAEPYIVTEAFSILRSYYGRLLNHRQVDPDLIERLKEAYFVLSDSDRRREYDAERENRPLPAIEPTPNEPEISRPPEESRVTRRQTQPSNGGAPSADVVPAAEVGANNGHTQLGSVTTAASTAIGAMGRQLTKMSKREQLRTQEKLAERVQVEPAGPDPEAVLLKRISSTVNPGARSALVGEQPIARVKVLEGPGGRAIFDLGVFPATIGGAQGCDITLPGLAEHHATLLHREGRFVVFNLTGREVDDAEDVDAVRLLENGHELKLGPYKLLFSVVAGEPPESSNSN